jgi:hypothetical protein
MEELHNIECWKLSGRHFLNLWQYQMFAPLSGPPSTRHTQRQLLVALRSHISLLNCGVNYPHYFARCNVLHKHETEGINTTAVRCVCIVCLYTHMYDDLELSRTSHPVAAESFRFVGPNCLLSSLRLNVPWIKAGGASR